LDIRKREVARNPSRSLSVSKALSGTRQPKVSASRNLCLDLLHHFLGGTVPMWLWRSGQGDRPDLRQADTSSSLCAGIART